MSNREEFEKAYTNAFIGEELKGLESIIFSRFEIGGEYAQDKVATAYAMWQARVPDGYKLVLVNEYYELVRSNRYKHEQNIELSKEVKVLRDRKKYYKSKYKAMIEAVEK